MMQVFSYIAVIFLLFFPKLLWAQQELTLHFMREVAQATVTNPALFPEKKMVISLPSFASNYGNNAFTYRDLIKKTTGDSTILDIDNVIDKLEGRNILQNQTSIELLRVHFRLHKNLYASVVMNEFFNTQFSYSRDLVEFLWNGNAGSTGRRIALNPDLHAVYYREMGLGLGYRWGNLRIGVNGKFLSGLANITTANENTTIFTDPETYAITIATDYQVNTAGIENFRADALSAALNLKNKGVALDVGLAYQVRKWEVSASFINYGFIRWQDDVINYANQGNFQYDGIGLSNYFDAGDFSFDQLLDSLKNTFRPKETHAGYKSNLVPKTYFSAVYHHNPFLSFGALMYTDWLREPQHALTSYASFAINQIWNIGFSYSIKNQTYNNVGLSLRVGKGNVQAFLVSDNFINTLMPKSAKNVNFRWGINFQINKIRGVNFR